MFFVGIFAEDFDELGVSGGGEPIGGGTAFVWIQAKVERAIRFESEAAVWVVQLHRRNAKISKDGIDAGNLEFGEQARESGEIGVASD